MSSQNTSGAPGRSARPASLTIAAASLDPPNAPVVTTASMDESGWLFGASFGWALATNGTPAATLTWISRSSLASGSTPTTMPVFFG